MSSDTSDHLPDERRQLILSLLADQNSLRVTDLAERLGVTPVTIRRDLQLLSDRGAVKRVHGGVTLRNQTPRTHASARPKTVGVSRANAPDSAAPVIGMVVPSLDYYWPSVARGAKDQATRRGMRLNLRESAYKSAEQDRKQIEHLVQHAGAKGLILTVDVRDLETLDLIQNLVNQGIPVVLVERKSSLPIDGTPVESVTTDHRSGAVLAVRTLTEMGHERIGMVCPSDSPTSPHLREGWEEACRDRGISPEATLNELIDNSTPELLLEETNRVLDLCLDHGVTALLVHADPEANMMLQVAQQHGLEVPGDLSIMAYDDAVASLFTPALSAVRPPRYTIGETAVDLIVSRLADPGRPIQRVILSPRLTIRESTQSR
ncbi:substrate-binding domain-containing protein [Actinomycetaceae bacterium MB13-C1-2]|nr:substrate-binding domain-containing protein [Actinomycetaceae bacterium MB13-C1-2]